MKTFKVSKEEIVKKCKAKNACESEFKRILFAANITEIEKVIYDNISWVRTADFSILTHLKR